MGSTMHHAERKHPAATEQQPLDLEEGGVWQATRVKAGRMKAGVRGAPRHEEHDDQSMPLAPMTPDLSNKSGRPGGKGAPGLHVRQGS